MNVYYKHKFPWDRRWTISKHAKNGGDRQIADGMSERYAAKIVKLLNEDEDRLSSYAPPFRELTDSEEQAEAATWD